MKCGALVLAAGNSIRFGSDKRLALVQRKTLLERSLEPYIELSCPLVVVTNQNLDLAQHKWLEALADVVIMPVDSLTGLSPGMGDSLAAGVRKANTLQWDAVLVGLADMPFVQTATVAELMLNLQKQALVVPVYQGQWGHPVGFKNTFFPDLMKLKGDVGGRSILKTAHPKEVNVDDQGVVLDIDTPEQLKHALHCINLN